MDNKQMTGNGTLSPYFSKFGVWAFSIGTSIGWGSFVVTCNTYLAQAGILGTVFGMLLGMAIILVINRNLCYMIGRSPSAGGIYTYGRKVAGNDAGFLVAWLLLLTYLAVLWANVTSFPLFARRFLGTFFQFGYCYSVFGYDVYIGEVLLSVAVLCLFGLLCSRSRKFPQILMIAMAVLFFGTVAVCTVLAMTGHGGSDFSFRPEYIPDKEQLNQILRIAIISPWAFIGFENVAHFSEEFTFPAKKIRGVMLASVILTTGFYILMTLLSVTAYPTRYDSWLEYIRDMNNLNGIEAVPAIYAASHYLGDTGISLMLLALLSVIMTSMIGNLTAISRLVYAFGRDHSWAEKITVLNKRNIPHRAIWATVLVSCLIPFLGRTAISWIVDVTTLGATIIYGFLSYFVMRDAKSIGRRPERITGILGLALMAVFAVLLLAPKLMSYEAMEAESYLLFAGWSLLGLAVFRLVLVRERRNQYGHSIVVWIVLLLLMLLTILMWGNRQTDHATDSAVQSIGTYYEERFEQGTPLGEEDRLYLEKESTRIEDTNTVGTVISFALLMAAIVLMLGNYRTAQKREKQLMSELGAAKEFGLTDSLTRVKNKHAYIQWEERINTQIEKGAASPFAMVVCDINNLKQMNDNYGHKMGDEYIRRVCYRICKIYSHSPVFRYGGDEFVVMLFGEDYQNRHELFAALADTNGQHGTENADSVAAGMSEFDPEQDRSLAAVFDRADRIMYENKRRFKQMAQVSLQLPSKSGTEPTRRGL